MTRPNPVAWLAFTIGAVVSVGANVLHALENTATIDVGRVVAAGWAPVALLLTVELMVRTRQTGGVWVTALRWTGTAVVAAVAALVSYMHMRDLLLSYGEEPLVAHILPLSVDGLMLVAALALASPGEHTEHVEEGAHSASTLAAPVEGGTESVPLAAPVPVPAANGTPDTAGVPHGGEWEHTSGQDAEAPDDRE